MIRRRQSEPVDPAAVDARPFVLEVWLDRLPSSYDVRPGWSTPAEHDRHRNARAYVLWIGARREAGRT